MTQEKLKELIQGIPEKNEIDAISSSEDFFYQKAKDAWEDWKATEIPPDLLEKLINMRYAEIRDSSESDVVEIRDKMFLFVAYCDTNASDKDSFNGYDDKRTIARNTLQQNQWVDYLLKFKKEEGKIGLSFWNVINYLENPNDNLPILQESHKGLIFSYFTGKSDDSVSSFVEEIKKVFSPFSQCENSINETAWIARVIYSLTNEWNPKEIKGLFAHDCTGWQDEAVEESKGGVLCLWWHKFPSSRYKAEIMDTLRGLVKNEENFDFYYIQNNYARYKATIIDLSTKEEYDSKVSDWQDYKPYYGFETEFGEYQDGKRSAAIVFLASKFEKLTSEIPVNNFVRFKSMPDHSRGGIVAYTRILTDNEIKTKKMIDDYVKLLRRKKNVILQGAPGTGKTYSTAEIAVKLIDGEQADFFAKRNALRTRYEELRREGRIFFTTFHQSLDYEDFVEGMKPKLEGGNVSYDIEDGIFMRACKAAKEQSVVLIIDEINRGNVSKIFGELITLIESDKREGGDDSIVATLPYSKDSFSVPSNLYIIGTMNTTDRSTGTLDYALRRRFAFITLESNKEVIEGYYDANDSSELKNVATTLFDNVKSFIKASLKSGDFDFDDLMVGHSYFMAEDEEELRNKMKYEVIPLIKEYINDGILNVDKKNANEIFVKWLVLETANI